MPSTNLAWPAESRPSAMSSTTGRPLTLAATAASVPAIGVEVTDAPPLRSCAASSATAAREAAGSVEEMTTAPFSSSRLPPLAKIPAEPIQLANSRRACAFSAPSALSGVISPCTSPAMLMPAVLSGGPPPSVLPSEARPCRSRTSCSSVLPTWPRPIASHDSPGSSPSACPLSGSAASRPPVAPAPARRERVGVEAQRAGCGHERDVGFMCARKSAEQTLEPFLRRGLGEACRARVDVGERVRRGRG